MMENRAAIIVPILALGLAVGLFFILFERVEQEFDLAPDGEVLRNPLWVAEAFLKEKGLEVESPGSFIPSSEMPPQNGVLINVSSRDSFGEKNLTILLDWVENGGHLIVSARGETDPILDHLGVELTKDGEVGQAEVRFGEEEHTYKLGLANIFRFDCGIEFDGVTLQDENGYTYTFDYYLGEGLISVFSDTRFLENGFLDEHDHAAFLWRLVNQTNKGAPVWIVWNETFPSIWSLLWKYAWMCVLSLLGLIVIYLWHRIPRMGPIAADPSPDRRSLMEHVAAAGRFYWRRHQGSLLVASTREAMMEQLHRRRPDWLALDQNQLAERLAECSGIEVAKVKKFLAKGADPDAATFLEQINVIETIRRSL